MHVVDIEGNIIEPGSEVVFSRNLWRGKDVLCRGKVLSVSPKFCQIEVTSPCPEGIELYEGWNITKRAKLSKVFVISEASFDDKYPNKDFKLLCDTKIISTDSEKLYIAEANNKFRLLAVNKKTIRCTHIESPESNWRSSTEFRMDINDFEINTEFIKK